MIPDKLIDDLERIGVYVIDVFDDYVEVSAESNEHLEYYPPFQNDPYVSRELQDLMDDYDCYLEWYNAGIAHITLDY
ncbi:MAG: hypothetical protein CMI60_11405 [Parvibaculum sp.]|nr:hypothetical protein [Parvibaculum sp.]